MSIAACAAAFAREPWTLALAESAAAVAAGTAVTVAQATLVDLHGDRRELAMTRWAAAGLAGDLAAPLVLALLPWRRAYLVVAALLAIWATFSLRPIPDARAEEDDDAPLFASLREALRARTLLRWLAALALCDLLDEILVVFASLHVRDDLGAGAQATAIVLAAFVAGGALGLAITTRALRKVAPLRLLALTAASCALAYAIWLASPTWWLSAIAMLAVGATAAPLYPIVAAQAYAALPGRSGTVNAAGHLFTPITMLLPFALGWVADHAGLPIALALLVIEPVGIAYAALAAARALRAQVPGS